MPNTLIPLQPQKMSENREILRHFQAIIAGITILNHDSNNKSINSSEIYELFGVFY